MPRPTTRRALLDQGKTNYKKLLDFIDELPDEVRRADFPPGTLNRNIRDVLAHLHHWHLMMLQWYAVGQKGGRPEMPAPGYTWSTTPALNKVIQEKYRSTRLDRVRKLLGESHERVRALVEAHTDNELFEKKRYAWTGSTSLGAYLVSATSSHYDWAYKLVKKATRTRS